MKEKDEKSSASTSGSVNVEKAVFDSLEKVAVSGLLGFLVGSFQRYTQIKASSYQPPHVSGVKFEEIASQTVKRGLLFGTLGVLLTGTLEVSRFTRGKVDTEAYMLAGSLAGLAVSLFFRPGLKASIRQIALATAIGGTFSIVEARLPVGDAESTSTTDSSRKSSLIEQMKASFLKFPPLANETRDMVKPQSSSSTNSTLDSGKDPDKSR